MGLKPAELYALSPLELEEMAAAYQDTLLERRWETAYWVSGIMNLIAVGPQRKPKGYRADALMKPFLPKKTGAEIARERQRFFESFNKQRREALKNGRDS